MQFNHVGISVSNLEQSMAFYGDLLGMEALSPPLLLTGEEVEDVTALKGLKARVTMMAKGNLALELFEFQVPAPRRQDPDYPVNNHGITHFGITVEDIDATYGKLAAEGVRFHSPVRQFPGGIRAAYGRDPDGNVFELLQMPQRV